MYTTGFYLQTVDQALQLIDGSKSVVVIIGHVFQDGQHLSIAADSLLDGGVDARKTLDGIVSISSADVDLLVEP